MTQPPPDHRDAQNGPSSDAEFDAPESSSWGKLVYHVIDEMPAHITVALFLVSFMFFYGMANTACRLPGVAELVKNLTARDFAEVLPSICLLVAAIGSVASTALILRIKYRKK